MKKLSLLFLTFLLLNSCGKLKDLKKEDRLNSFKQISENFTDPPAEYRTLPFWVWNEKVTKKMIDEQLPEFKENGFGGVFVHPRYGLITEYLSDEWFELVKYAKEKAEELGMKLWLYDENSFPSGFAGGHVPTQMPESYNNGIAMKKHEMQVLDPDIRDWIGFYKKEGDKYVEISDDIEKYRGKEGDFIAIEKIFYAPTKWYGGYTYIDLIHPGVTEKFIEITMTGYENALGEDFGEVVPGIFTDEPNISPGGRGTLRWTSDLFEVFRNTWGYDLKDELVSLFYETGDWSRIRHNYYSVLLDLFIERWSEPWYKYTEEKGLKWTGHYWEHGWPDPVHGGDNMAMYPYHQVPGIDMLFNTHSGRPDQFGNVRAVKELSSIANQFGRSRTLSETYGASGYELNFEDMKRNGDWQYALGVNLMNQHLSYQSMLGDRKHDFPQTFSYHTPWWDEYKGQADYFARLSLALSSGYQVNDILVIEPTTTAWMHYVPGSENREIVKIREEFHKFLDEMELLKLEYDLASEKTMKDFANVRENQIVIKERSYSQLILPYGLTNLDRSSFGLIEKFLESGGELVSFCGYPEYIDGIKSSEVKEIFSKHEDRVVLVESPAESYLPELTVSKEVVFSPREKAEGVYFMRRQLKDGDLLFLANFTPGEEKEFHLNFAEKQDVVELDPVNGTIYQVRKERTDNELRIKVQLPDAGSRLYFVSSSKIKIRAEEKEEWKPEQKEELFITGIERHSPNVMVLDYCYLEFPGEENPSDELNYFYHVHDKIFQKHGFADNPWVSSSQFKTEILDRDTFGMNSGFKVSFPFFINEGVDMGSIKIVVERPELYTVFMNGMILQPIEGEYYVDKGTGVYSAGNALATGPNMVTLVGQPFSVLHELAPVFVTGNFSVQPASQGWELYQEVPLDLGSWKEYGLPFYPKEVSYHASFRMEKDERAMLSLEDWTASCVTVSVNDSEDILLWTPYRLDISKWLTEGENWIRITLNGSLKNLNGPHHNNPQEGLVTPWSFKYAPEDLPPALDYDLIEYGLFEAPVLLK
jgi:hypothetical protein